MNFIKGIKSLLGDVEMAPYTVVATHENYEERLYPSKKWICTTSKGISRDDCRTGMFRLLFNYISGKNKENIRIDMTTPVTTYVVPGASATCESTFTMAFFVPEEHQDTPPEPVDDKLFIQERPEMKVLTRIYGGFATDDIVTKEAKELAEILLAAEEKGVNFDQYYVVGYDPPYKPIRRRNEIWFLKTGESQEKKSDSTN